MQIPCPPLSPPTSSFPLLPVPPYHSHLTSLLSYTPCPYLPSSPCRPSLLFLPVLPLSSTLESFLTSLHLPQLPSYPTSSLLSSLPISYCPPNQLLTPSLLPSSPCRLPVPFRSLPTTATLLRPPALLPLHILPSTTTTTTTFPPAESHYSCTHPQPSLFVFTCAND